MAGLQLLARDSVVHFDLKCANVLLEPVPGVSDTQLWCPLGNACDAKVWRLSFNVNVKTNVGGECKNAAGGNVRESDIGLQ